MKKPFFWLHAIVDLELQVIGLYHCSRYCYLHIPKIGGFLAKCVRHLMRVYSGCDISPKAVIGKELQMPHPLGIVIGDDVQIGDNVKIWHRVTLGSHGKKDLPWQYPKISNDVRIYNGASIIGNVSIGEGAIIGAHSLVLEDVPAGATAVGSPSRVIRQKFSEPLPGTPNP